MRQRLHALQGLGQEATSWSCRKQARDWDRVKERVRSRRGGPSSEMRWTAGTVGQVKDFGFYIK